MGSQTALFIVTLPLSPFLFSLRCISFRNRSQESSQDAFSLSPFSTNYYTPC
jgi:hypothetical protein